MKRYHWGYDQHSGCWRVYDSEAASPQSYMVASFRGDALGAQDKAAAKCRRLNEDHELIHSPYNPMARLDAMPADWDLRGVNAFAPD